MAAKKTAKKSAISGGAILTRRPERPTDDNIREVIFSFDTTGSMFPCLTQVRRNVDATIKRLFDEVLNIRVGVIAHGDYCDGRNTLLRHELSTNQNSLSRFVREAPQTGGGDAEECYELVLRRAQSFNWTMSKNGSVAGISKVLVLIADDRPHSPSDRQNTEHIDWRAEARALRDLGIRVYTVQCLNRSYATSFYREVAQITGGYHLTLDQFSDVTELLLAIGYQQAGEEHLERYEREVIDSRRMNRNLDRIFATLRGRRVSAAMGDAADLRAVPPGRFQVLNVDEDSVIRDFVTEQGLTFARGRGFYELTKAETIQGTKEIVLQNRRTGDLFTGTRARELLGLPLHDEDVRLRATHLEEYTVFVQSTSFNRRLVGSTRFLYEVDDWDRSEAAA